MHLLLLSLNSCYVSYQAAIASAVTWQDYVTAWFAYIHCLGL